MRRLNFLICFIATIVVPDISSIYSKEVYIPQDIINTTWGTSYYQIGLIKGLEDRRAIGPASLKVDENNDIYILDAVNKRIQKYDNNGRLLLSIPIKKPGIDFCIDSDGHIYLILYSRIIEKYSQEGILLSEYQIPDSIKFVTNITHVKRKMESIVVVETGEQRSYLFEPKILNFNADFKKSSKLKSQKGYPSKFIDAYYITQKINKYSGIIKNLMTNSEIEVVTSDPLASLVFIDTDKFGNIFVSVESFLGGPTINVKREIRKYNPNGEILARIKLYMNYYTFPNSDVAINDNGVIYQLRPLKNKVQVLKIQKR